MIEWLKSTNTICGITAGQMIGIILAALVIALTVYAYIKDSALIVTEYDTGDVITHHIKTGKRMHVREEVIK